MGRSIELKRLASRVSWGFVETLSGLLLYQFALGVSLATTTGGKRSGTVSQALEETDQLSDQLFTTFDPSQIKSAFYHLKRKGLIKTIKSKRYEAKITKRGLNQLEQELPQYQEERPWDKRVYLINYDIEEEDSNTRKNLYQFLHEIKCAPLQRSTFLSVYNPRGLLKLWRKDHIPLGDILVSDLGPDGALGERPLEDLVADAYQLTKINIQYAGFLKEFSYSPKNQPAQLLQAFFSFNAILKQDPQLPFELLPNDWLGDRAYQRYRKILGDSLGDLR